MTLLFLGKKRHKISRIEINKRQFGRGSANDDCLGQRKVFVYFPP